MSIFGFGAVDSFSIPGLLVSVGGAAILIAIISSLKRR